MKRIMCESEGCDYPITKKETKTWLEESLKSLQKILKELTGAEQEWINTIYEKIREATIEKMCTTCAVKLFFGYLILENNEVNLAPIILDWGLDIISRVSVVQHVKAVLHDSEKKMRNTRNSNFENFPMWFMMRVQRMEYTHPKNLTKGERELMRKMRSKGESLRDLAYILDRSVSTVQQNCQGVEASKTGVYY
jgi:hypothetical protein